MTLRGLLPVLLMAALALLPARAARADEAAEVQKLIRAGDLPGALKRAEAAAAAQPHDASVRFLEGVILIDLKRDDQALDVFQHLTEDFPDLPDPYNNIALLQARAGKLDAARIALETALRNDPNHAVARTNLGEIYLRLAIQAWETVAAATPGDATLQRKLKLARELAAMGR